MSKYTVTVKAVEETEPGAFVSLSNYDVEIEYEQTDDTGNEIWTIETDSDIERLLDTSDGVISYTVE